MSKAKFEKFAAELESDLISFLKEQGIAYGEVTSVVNYEQGFLAEILFTVGSPTSNLMSKNLVTIRRLFDLTDEKSVEHSYFKLDDSLQKIGINSYLQRKSSELYDALDIQRIDVHANIDVGGYAWLRHGFVPTNHGQWSVMATSFQRKLDVNDPLYDEKSKFLEKLRSLYNSDKFTEAKNLVRSTAAKYKATWLGTDWYGSLDYTDPETKAMYLSYVEETGKTKPLYQKYFAKVEQAAKQTANEALHDAMVRHQIGLLRVSGSIRNEIVELLNNSEASLKAALEKRLGSGTWTEARIKSLLEDVRSIRSEAHKQVYDVWRERMTEVTQGEVNSIAAATTAVSPVILELTAPETSTLKSLVNTHPFEGKTLKEWADGIAKADIDRLTGQIRIGIVQGETIEQIARRLVGTVANAGKSGSTEITRRDAINLTRTAVNTFANEAKREFAMANQDIADEEGFFATLDNRTTLICQSNDGKKFPIGVGPRPPLHWGCRSLRLLLLNGEFLGTRPLKSSTERELVKEFAQQENLSGVKTRDQLPRGKKGSFDEFARRRVRELTGSTTASTSYQQFLERQSVMFQEDVLGITKAKLFRSGGLKLDQFLDRDGNELTLSQLAKKEAAAFRAAGLDPGKWL